MTGEDFITRCWKCLEVRQHIIDQARRRGKHNREVQQDYIQEAWLAISTVPHCYGIEGCKYLVERTIYSSYWQENKTRLIFNNPGFVGNVDDTDGWAGEDHGTLPSSFRAFSAVLQRMKLSELSETIANQLVDFLVPVLEKMGWTHD